MIAVFRLQKLIPCLLVTAPLAYGRQNAAPAPPAGFKLTINLVGLRNLRGLLHISLYNSANRGRGFPGSDKNAFRLLVVPASSVAVMSSGPDTSKRNSQTAVVTFENLPPDVYAVAMYHDENANHRMDTYWYGKPREGAAASNNPRPFMRAPHFREAAFSLRSDATITLNLWYP